MKEKNWYFDETIQQGIDYRNEEIVNGYDASHTQFRDYEDEVAQIIEKLDLNSGHRVIDFGVGTGAFTIAAAALCKHIDAVDVSEVMLRTAQTKAEEYKLNNIAFHLDGFLSYKHRGPCVDCIVTIHAFHHLPDLWKMIALRRMYHMLVPGGKLFLQDTVFPSKASDDLAILDEWVETIRVMADENMAQEAIVHIREEYSTYNWILEGMMERSGFKIEYKDYSNHLLATYVCIKDDGGGG